MQYHHRDHLGTLRLITDEMGGKLEGHDYEPFGVELNPPVGTASRKKYTGHERDESTGLDYMLARYYPATTGRFLSVDPGVDVKAGNPASWNLYGYVENNPEMKVDPSGRAGVDAIPFMASQQIHEQYIANRERQGVSREQACQELGAGYGISSAIGITGGVLMETGTLGWIGSAASGLWDKGKEFISKGAQALSNIVSRTSPSQTASDPISKVKAVINSATPMDPTSKGIGQGGIQNVQKTFEGLAKSLGVKLPPGAKDFTVGNIRIGQHISSSTGVKTLDINLNITVKRVAENLFKLREL